MREAVLFEGLNRVYGHVLKEPVLDIYQRDVTGPMTKRCTCQRATGLEKSPICLSEEAGCVDMYCVSTAGRGNRKTRRCEKSSHGRS